MEKQIIVSHVSPDWDAICSLWLLQRFGPFADAEITLVNTGAPDAELLANAAAVVDTGRVFDPRHWRFDHHQLSGAEANETCAAMQVYHRLIFYRNEIDLGYLDPLIALIYAGDTGKATAAQSRQVGIHALLSAKKAGGESNDDMLLLWGYWILDDLAAHLKRAYDARESLAQFTVYTSADGLLVALDQSSRAAVNAAHDAGARLVLWHRSFAATETIELWRGGDGPDVDCRIVVLTAIGDPTLPQDELDEMSSWYLHEAGFYAGRGSDKAPDPTPLQVRVAILAAYLDAAWSR